MRTGLGLNWLSDNLGSEFGFNFTYKGDFFPMDPLVISAELDLGKTGSSNLAHVRVTTGMNYRHAEIFAGYDHFRLDETEFAFPTQIQRNQSNIESLLQEISIDE